MSLSVPGTSRAIISRNKLTRFDGGDQDNNMENMMPKLQAETVLSPNRTG